MTLIGTGGLAVAMLLSVAPVFACSCAAELSPAQAAQQADVAFTGVVISLKLSHPNWPLTSSMDPVDVKFRVDAVFKGTVALSQNARTAASDASCGFPFEAGQRYTVFGRLYGATVVVDLCNGTRAGSIDSLAVGLPARTPAQVTAADQAFLPPAGTWIVGLASIVLLGLGLMIARRKFSR